MFSGRLAARLEDRHLGGAAANGPRKRPASALGVRGGRCRREPGGQAVALAVCMPLASRFSRCLCYLATRSPCSPLTKSPTERILALPHDSWVLAGVLLSPYMSADAWSEAVFHYFAGGDGRRGGPRSR